MVDTKFIGRAALFGIAGIASNLANIFAFWLCIELLDLKIITAGSIGYFAGMFVGFCINHKVTFAGQGRGFKRVISYVAIQLSIYCFYLLINIIIIEPYNAFALYLHIAAILSCAMLNFCFLNIFWRKNDALRTHRKR